MEELVNSQRIFFDSHISFPVAFRIRQLKKLRHLLKKHEESLYEAIYDDFHKSAYETYISELGLIYHEINKALKKLRKWTRPQSVRTNLLNMPGRSYLFPVPIGVVLVIGTWNFPYMLTLIPALSALAAGNTVIIKPSEITGKSGKALTRLINGNFEPEYLHVVEGGVPVTTELIKQKFDKIFFTGSTQVGRIIYQAAARNLTPVTLEMGGKNPVLITDDCNLKMAAKRLIWAKFLNAGQSCVSPDYVLIPASLKEKFLELAINEIEQSCFSIENNNYVRIVDQQHMDRLVKLIDPNKIRYGGRYNIEKRHIEPTLLTDIDFSDKIMKGEIFGPLLPVIEYTDLTEVIRRLRSLPAPLACYIYTRDKKIKNRILREVSFGGGAINDSVMHFINSNLPFGGVGSSGIGAYHGKHGFDTFTHYKGILERPTWFEIKLKYFPHTSGKLKIIRRLLE